MYPIFIPVYHEEPKCPHCHRSESIKEVCEHCDYVYSKKNDSTMKLFIGWTMFIGTIIGMIFVTPHVSLTEPGIIDYFFGGAFGAIFSFLGLLILCGLSILFSETIKKFIKK